MSGNVEDLWYGTGVLQEEARGLSMYSIADLAGT